MYSIGSDTPKRKRKKWKKQRPDWLPQAVCEDYRAGLTVQELAKKYHINSPLVSQYLHEAGLLGQKPKQTPASPVLRDLIENILQTCVVMGHAPDDGVIARIMDDLHRENKKRRSHYESL